MPDDHILEEMSALKKEIQAAMKEEAQAEGRLQAAIERLDKTHAIEEAELEKEIHRTGRRKDRVEEELREKFTKLKEEYQW